MSRIEGGKKEGRGQVHGRKLVTLSCICPLAHNKHKETSVEVSTFQNNSKPTNGSFKSNKPGRTTSRMDMSRVHRARSSQRDQGTLVLAIAAAGVGQEGRRAGDDKFAVREYTRFLCVTPIVG